MHLQSGRRQEIKGSALWDRVVRFSIKEKVLPDCKNHEIT